MPKQQILKNLQTKRKDFNENKSKYCAISQINSCGRRKSRNCWLISLVLKLISFFFMLICFKK